MIKQLCAQQRAGAVEPDLHIRFGNAHDLGDLARRQPLKVAKKHHHAQCGRQARQRRPHASAQPLIDRRFIGQRHPVRDIERAGVGLMLRRLADMTPPFHQARVADRLIQPGSKRLGLPDLANMPVCAKQRILHDVFRILGVTAHEKTETKRHCLRARQQVVHRASVTGGGAADKRRIIGTRGVGFTKELQFSGSSHGTWIESVAIVPM